MAIQKHKQFARDKRSVKQTSEKSRRKAEKTKTKQMGKSKHTTCYEDSTDLRWTTTRDGKLILSGTVEWTQMTDAIEAGRQMQLYYDEMDEEKRSEQEHREEDERYRQEEEDAEAEATHQWYLKTLQLKREAKQKIVEGKQLVEEGNQMIKSGKQTLASSHGHYDEWYDEYW